MLAPMETMLHIYIYIWLSGQQSIAVTHRLILTCVNTSLSLTIKPVKPIVLLQLWQLYFRGHHSRIVCSTVHRSLLHQSLPHSTLLEEMKVSVCGPSKHP